MKHQNVAPRPQKKDKAKDKRTDSANKNVVPRVADKTHGPPRQNKKKQETRNKRQETRDKKTQMHGKIVIAFDRNMKDLHDVTPPHRHVFQLHHHNTSDISPLCRRQELKTMRVGSDKLLVQLTAAVTREDAGHPEVCL